MAISCVIPACLNTNIQNSTAAEQTRKRAERKKPCIVFPSRQEPRCRADGKRLGLARSRGSARSQPQPRAPGSVSRSQVSSFPPPLAQPRGSRRKSSSAGKDKRGSGWELVPKEVTGRVPRLDAGTAFVGGEGTASEPLCPTVPMILPLSALHTVPLVTQVPHKPIPPPGHCPQSRRVTLLTHRHAVCPQPASALKQSPSPRSLLAPTSLAFTFVFGQVYATETPPDPCFDVLIGKLWWPALLTRLTSAKGIFHFVSRKLQQGLGTLASGSVHLPQRELPSR